MKEHENWDDRYQLLNQPYLRWGIVTTAVNFAAGVDDRAAVILCTAALTVTLPLAADSANKVYWIKNIGVGAVTIAPSGPDLIDGAASQSLPDQYDVMAVVCDGLNWYVLSFTNL
jgi:hypothetical protein